MTNYSLMQIFGYISINNNFRKCTEIYAQFIKRIPPKIPIFIDVLILSELINRLSRLDFDQTYRKKYQNNFKKYRQSHDYKDSILEVTDIIRRITKLTTRCSTPFINIDMNGILNDLE